MKRLVWGNGIVNGQIYGLGKVSVSLAAQQLQGVVSIWVDIPCSCWEHFQEEWEVDPPAMGVVPAERALCHGMLWMQEVCTGSRGDWTSNLKKSTVGY